ncbi:MAG: hypothetical protein ACR2G7_07040, partial [Acidimicrobiales bacterium]
MALTEPCVDWDEVFLEYTRRASAPSAMAAGGVLAGMRAARRLGDDVVPMDAVAGAKTNLVSAALVGSGHQR